MIGSLLQLRQPATACNEPVCPARVRNNPGSFVLRFPKTVRSEVSDVPHIILLGDSIFDNLRYVQPGPDVLAQLREMLPVGWKASLLAVDGAVTNDVEEQLAGLPSDATHLVLSVGGNDLLGCAEDLLRTPVHAACQLWPVSHHNIERRY